MQPLFPALLDLLVEFSILLLQQENLLRDPYNQPHPQKSLQLATWKVSGDIMLFMVFLVAQEIVQEVGPVDGVNSGQQDLWPAGFGSTV